MGLVMRILAFDPGHTTGFALIEDNKILLCGVIDCTFPYISRLIDLAEPNLVVIEDIPAMTADKITQEKFASIKFLAEIANKKLLVVKPGVWKPLRQAKNKEFIPHVQDAIGLAEYAERISNNA